MPPRRSGRTAKPTAKYSAYKAALTTRKPRKKREARATPALKKAITKVVKSNQETKLIIEAPFNYNSGATLETWTQFSTAITSTGEIYSLVPPCQQGTQDHQRIGDQIQPVGLTVKVNVALGALASSSIYADIWFVTSKNIKDPKLTGQIQTAEFLNVGDGTNANYDGTSYTAMLPVNKREFNVLTHKRILLKKPYGDPQGLYSGAGAPPNSVYTQASNIRSFSVKVPLPKKLMYNNQSDYTASNTFPFMMVGFYAADQFGGTALTPTLPLYVQAQSHLYFKDA